MSNQIEQLNELKEKNQKKKEDKIRFEQQLKTVEENQAKKLQELTPLEVKPEDLGKIIEEETKKIEEELVKLNGLVNG